jgi:hypothetical protein
LEHRFSKWVSQSCVRDSRATKMHNGRRVLLAVLNLYVRIKIPVATWTLIIPSPMAITQSLLQSRSFQIL